MSEIKPPLRPGLPELPKRFHKLPVGQKGYPVPSFAAPDGDDWDFRMIKDGHYQRCVRHRLCWLCGEPLGKWTVFVIGPMCVINRVSSEPPSHRDCAEFAIKACPFLNNPAARRSSRDLPDGAWTPGNMLTRNPGANALVTAPVWKLFRANPGVLIRFEEPFTVEWYSRGRTATPEEVWQSIESGLPILRAEAEKEGDPAIREFERCMRNASAHLPPRPEAV